MLREKISSGEVGYGDDTPAPITGQKSRHGPPELRALQAKCTRQMRFQSDHEWAEAQRDAVECMNKIERTWRPWIEYRYAL